MFSFQISPDTIIYLDLVVSQTGSPRHTESTKYPALMLLCDLIAEDPSKQNGCYSGCFRENVEEFLSCGGVDLILLLAEKFVSFRRPALVIFAAVRKRIGKW